MAGYVERGAVPGVVTLLERHGETHGDAIGAQAIGGAPMRRDTIFRIASMIKPITAVVAMILVEECRLRLDDSVQGLLPELANRRVLKRIDGPLAYTVPANHAITLRDLLTFRLGYGSVIAPPGSYPIQRSIGELRIGGDGPPQPAQVPAPDQWMRNLGSLPLIYQPGERWLYNFCRMMLAHGKYSGGRILSRPTVEAMTSDQVTPEQRVGAEMFFRAAGSPELVEGQAVSAENEERHERDEYVPQHQAAIQLRATCHRRRSARGGPTVRA